MKTIDFSSFFIYKWRYYVGYTLLGLILIGGLVFSSFYVPGGLTADEVKAVVTSDALTPMQLLGNSPAHAPYYLLQHVSLWLFGVTLVGVKLPSLILGVLTAVGMVLLLRRWFSPGIAMLTAIVAVATGQFLFLAQHGFVGILYLFWPTMLLLLGTIAANKSKYGVIWKVLFFITAALSLYSPLSIYVLIALGSAVLLHPHLRYLIKRLSRVKILIGALVGLALAVPLGWTIIQHPLHGLTLLGIPSEMPNIVDNLRTLAQQYFNFTSVGTNSLMTPVFGLGSTLIILYGLYRLIRTRNTVQSYVILTWLGLLLPILVLNPLFTSITFVPLLLLLATGLEGILRTWYGLFPRNPYARVAGLLPIVILTSSLVLFGLERYAFGYTYSPTTVRHFSRDIILLPKDTRTLKVGTDEQAFYAVVAKHRKDLTVTTTTPKDTAYVATRAAKDNKKVPIKVIVDHTYAAPAPDRFYLYDK